jgi:hypothetical protein
MVADFARSPAGSQLYRALEPSMRARYINEISLNCSDEDTCRKHREVTWQCEEKIHNELMVPAEEAEHI